MEWWFPEAEGEGDGELLFNGYRVVVRQYENILEVDDGDDCQTMNIFNAAHVCK